MYRANDTKWKFWFHTNALLIGSITIAPVLQFWAALLMLYQVVYFAQQSDPCRPLCLQVRLAYLAMVLLGSIPSLLAINYLLIAGTTWMLVSDQCLLSFVLQFMPWNREGECTQ